ncbi:MAG: DNA oxidative demethylase AlkB [Azovibrio sp.]|nr:DNA oxidative demethylase AlkB [Azovibrio sp.]
MQTDLFATLTPQPERLDLAPGVVLWRQQLTTAAPALLAELPALLACSPFRHMQTPGGHTLSVAMSNCGSLGWITDRQGYRYSPVDPQTGRPWPAIPASWRAAASAAAQAAGFADFLPDACLINRYAPGARMGLHQDKDEANLDAPIVSFSFGLAARFLLGGLTRRDKVERIWLTHGDVLVWGGPARLRLHGIQAVTPGQHPLTGAYRINLTLRQAGRPQP